MALHFPLLVCVSPYESPNSGPGSGEFGVKWGSGKNSSVPRKDGPVAAYGYVGGPNTRTYLCPAGRGGTLRSYVCPLDLEKSSKGSYYHHNHELTLY